MAKHPDFARIIVHDIYGMVDIVSLSQCVAPCSSVVISELFWNLYLRGFDGDM